MHKSLALALQRQPDSFILAGIERLILLDQKQKSKFLIFLSEVDRRKLYAEAGYSCLYKWLIEVHHLSESSALKRIQVARLAQKFPFLYECVAKGEYTLTALSKLSHFVNGKNSGMLFAAARGKSVRAVEAMLADKFPKAEIKDKLGKSVSPLGEDRYHVQFTADKEFAKDLKEAKALLSHRFPQGKLKDILGLSLKTLLKDLRKESKHIPRGIQKESPKPAPSLRAPRDLSRLSQKAKPEAILPVAPQVQTASVAQAGPAKLPTSRYIPRGIRTLVEKRDNYRCQHIRPDGSICGETHFLEQDHITPFACGGKHTAENLRLLCRAHNVLRAEKQFWKAVVRVWE